MLHKPTSGSEWRKKAREGGLILLPSGMTARVRNIPISAVFTQTDGAYNTLMPLISEFISNKELNEESLETLMETKGEQFFNTLNLFCRLAFVSPRIVEDPQGEDEIAITDLDDGDKMVVLQLLGMPAQQLERFCQVYSESMAGLLSEQAVHEDAFAHRPDASAIG